MEAPELSQYRWKLDLKLEFFLILHIGKTCEHLIQYIQHQSTNVTISAIFNPLNLYLPIDVPKCNFYQKKVLRMT